VNIKRHAIVTALKTALSLPYKPTWLIREKEGRPVSEPELGV